MRCRTVALALAAAYQIEATTLNINGNPAIQGTAATLAQNLMGYYNEADVGVLPQPYYWWESGAMWGGLIDYWHYTGDASYNDAASKALLAQAGPTLDFMGPQTDGNDDQGWWAISAMSAAEYGLPIPAGAPSWLALAQNVFTEMSSRWDTTSCNGGMKWKIAPSAAGFDYKNSISNGLFFQLAARLARFTGNADYVSWAEKSFDWVQSVGLMDKNYNVYDGTDDTKGCSDVDHDQWSYNVGVFLYGAAVLQDYTKDPKWADRTTGLLAATNTFFDSNVMLESKCEKDGSCNVDQLSFKAYLSRWMAGTSVLVPSTQSTITTLLGASAGGAVASCSTGPNQQTCGVKWYTKAWDGTSGVGQQLAALEVVHGLLAGAASPPQAQRKLARRFQA